MKNIITVIVLVGCLSLLAGDKVRQFDADGNPLPLGKVGVYQLVTTTETEWNDSGCPSNTKLENGVVRFKSENEKKAEKDAQDAVAKDKWKESEIGKLEARIEKLEAEIAIIKGKQP